MPDTPEMEPTEDVAAAESATPLPADPIPLGGAGGPVGGPVAGEVVDALNQPLLGTQQPDEQ